MRSKATSTACACRAPGASGTSATSRLAERHLAAGMPHVVGGDYVGEHWLASLRSARA